MTSFVALPGRLRAHLAIARVDHWVKNVFVLPGAAVVLSVAPPDDWAQWTIQFLQAMTAICLIASSYYTLNEILDAPFDKLHPLKRHRPVPSGRVHIGLAYVQWIGLGALGLAVATAVNRPFAAVAAALWTMGCIYNVPPVRTKDVPYLDVLTEALNNPLRMLAGWYVGTETLIPPGSLLLSYWMVGCYFMALKRYSECREMPDLTRLAAYRKSFRWYTEERLLISVTFYGAAAMLFFGAFVVRYRMELVLAFPLVAWVMASYLALSFRPHSPVQHPEALYKQPWLMVAVACCAAAMTALLFVDLPWLYQALSPTVPAIR